MTRKLKPADEQLWRAVTADVTPLGQRHKPVEQMETPKKSPVRREFSQRVIVPSASISKEPEIRHGQAPGVDRRTATRLQRGQMRIEGRIDLHGHTQETAHRQLNAFIENAYAQGRRAVLVITGKGKGVLQNAVPRWLNQPPLRRLILSFNYAQPKDGGGGALYVLIRKKK